MSEKPLFIPLCGKYFDQFAIGTKNEELRRYGLRWNERTCWIGRPVVLSRGYGKQHRLKGTIWKFTRQHATTLGSTYKASVLERWGTLDMLIACISVTIRPELPSPLSGPTR